MKVRIRKASPGEKPRFVSKLNNLVNKAKGGKTAAVENFIESEIENGTDPETIISKLEKYNVKGSKINSLVYDLYSDYEDSENYYNTRKQKAPYEAPAPYEEKVEEVVEEPSAAELYDYDSPNPGLQVLAENDDEDEEEYGHGGALPSKSKFIKSYVKKLKKAAQGDQVSNNEFYLPPTGDIDDPMGNYTKQNQMFAGAVKQIGNDAMLQKQAEQAYQNMFAKAEGGSQEPHDWIDELHGYGESLQHAMPNTNENTINSFAMKEKYGTGGKIRRANKAVFGTPYGIPGVNVDYQFGPLGGLKRATTEWDVQALGNLVNLLPGAMNMMPGMMNSGWKSVTYPAQVRKKVVESKNNEALNEVAKNTPNSDATQKQKTGRKKQLTCPPGSFYDAARDMCVDMNGIPMPSQIDLPSAEELLVNPWVAENGGYVDQSMIDPNNPQLMKFIYGGDEYAEGGNVLPKALNGFETWARDRVNLDGSLKNKPSLSYDATNPFARKNPLEEYTKYNTNFGSYGNLPPVTATNTNQPTTNQNTTNQNTTDKTATNQNQTTQNTTNQNLSPQQLQQLQMQMAFGRPQRLGFGLSRDFNYTQGFSPNWNVPEGTQHMRQETFKDRGKWYNPFDTKRITDWYADPEKNQGTVPPAATPPGATPPAAPEDKNNIYSNTEGLSGKSKRAIRRGERKTARQVARGMEEFPEAFEEGTVNPFAKESAADVPASNAPTASTDNNAPGYNPNASAPGYSGAYSDANGDGIPDYLAAPGSPQGSNPARAYSGSGLGAMERADAFDISQTQPQPTEQQNVNASSAAPQAPAYNTLYPAGTSSSTGIDSIYEPDMYDMGTSEATPENVYFNTQLSNPGMSNPYARQNPLGMPTPNLDRRAQASGRPGPQLSNPGMSNPYSRPNPLSLGFAEGGFIPSYMHYAYGGNIPMANNGITVNQPEFNDPNFVGRTIEQSAYTFDPRQMGADLFRGKGSIFGLATQIGNAIDNEKNVLDPMRKQYRTSDAATANTGQSGFGSAEVTGSQMGDKGWYNQWGKNIENVGFEGNEVNTKMGGTGNKQYKKGRVYTLTLDQIKAIEAAGGKIEYLK